MQIAPASNGKIVKGSYWVPTCEHQIGFVDGGLLFADSNLELDSIELQLMPVDMGTPENPLTEELACVQNPPDKQFFPE
jgi:hypothetical protein